MKEINNVTPEMLELINANQEDSEVNSYVASLKASRDHWEKEAIAAQAELRRMTRNNKVLQLRIEQLETPTLDFEEERMN